MNKKVLAFIGLLILLALILVLELRTVKTLESTEQPPVMIEMPSTSPKVVQIKVPLDLTLIYSQEIRSINNGDRLWPIERILLQNGSGEPQILATIGKEGEYPINFILSPDRNYLLINLEKKLQLLNIQSKKLKDLFGTKGEIATVAYSPDGKRIFIWEEPSKGKYAVHIFNVMEEQDSIVKEGVTTDNPFGTAVWRNDDKILLKIGHGESVSLSYYDLGTNNLVKSPVTFIQGPISSSGKLVSVSSEIIGNVCDFFAGSADSVFGLNDPISGKIIGQVGDIKSITEILSFSLDDREILYRTGMPKTSLTECDETLPQNYYLKNLVTGEVFPKNDLFSLFREWHGDYAGVEINYDYANKQWLILLNDRPIATSKMPLRIIAQYYQ